MLHSGYLPLSTEHNIVCVDYRHNVLSLTLSLDSQFSANIVCMVSNLRIWHRTPEGLIRS